MVNNGFLKATLFALCFNFTFGNSFYDKSDFSLASNYTIDTIKTLKVKTTCQILSDCSEDALECRKDSNNGNKSYCVYPEYVCSDNNTCYLLNNRTIDNDTPLINSLNATSECTKDEECPYNKCTSGQCQVSVDSLVMYCKTTQNMENTVYQCGKLIGDHCESDVDCVTSKCDPNSKICVKNDTLINNANNNNKKDNNSSKKSNVTLYVVIGIGIVVGIFLIITVVYVCGQSAQYVDENPEFKEMREENRKRGVPAAILVI